MNLCRSMIAAGMFALGVSATVAHGQTVAIVTTPAGSFSHSAASAIAKVMVDRAKLRAIVQAQASTGFEEVDAGDAEFSVANSFDATFFTTGTGEYAGQPPKSTIRNVGSFVPLRVAMHVRADSPIKTMADLKGKRVSSDFNAQKTIVRIIEAHLANAGLGWNDVTRVPAPNVVRGAEDFTSGKVDVLFFAIGSGSVKQANASVGGLRVLEVNASDDALKRMQTLLPGSYVMKVEPSPALEGISKPTNLMAFDLVMIASAKVSDDIVYRTVKAAYENKADLVATFPPMGLFDPKGMAKPLQSVQMHPGAVKFFRETGLLKL